MNGRFRDLCAPVYRQAMKADRDIYTFMYRRIPVRIKDREVLEIATGPGLLALQVAPYAKRMIATDGLLIAPNFVTHHSTLKSKL